jgi:recombination protein RecA
LIKVWIVGCSTKSVTERELSKIMAIEKSEKMKAVEAALANLEKQFGKGTVMRLGDNVQEDIPVISTSSIGIDAALGVGGVPRGRIIEVYGPESSGKTTLALHIVAEAQKAGGIAAYVDAEHALDAVYARKLGVDIDNLFVSQPDSGEQALEITESLVRSNAVDILVVDSVAALTPRAELEGEMGDSLPGLQARLMSQALRKLTAVVSKSNTCLIFINQIREKIGVMFGSPETTTGGRALKFYSSARLDIRRITQIKDGDSIIGNRTKVKVVKNKVAPPFREAEFDIMYGEGISKYGELIDIGVENKVVDKSGAWFSYKGERLGQGRENAKNTLKENKELCAKVEAEVRSALGIGKPVPAAASAPGSGKPQPAAAPAAVASASAEKSAAAPAAAVSKRKSAGDE